MTAKEEPKATIVITGTKRKLSFAVELFGTAKRENSYLKDLAYKGLGYLIKLGTERKKQ